MKLNDKQKTFVLTASWAATTAAFLIAVTFVNVLKVDTTTTFIILRTLLALDVVWEGGTFFSMPTTHNKWAVAGKTASLLLSLVGFGLCVLPHHMDMSITLLLISAITGSDWVVESIGLYRFTK